MYRLLPRAALALTLWAPLALAAQNPESGVPEKGTFWIGSTTALRITENDNLRLADLFARTRVGYVFADNWGVAVSFIHQNTNEDTPGFESTNRRLVLNANVRRFLPLSKKLTFYGLIGYNYDLTTNERRDLTTDTQSDGAFIRHTLGFSLGLFYFVTRRFAIESQFGTFVTDLENTPYDGRGYRVVSRLNLQPQRAAQNFSFFSLSYFFRR